MKQDVADRYFMKQALAQAVRAETHGEVPVGAVAVKDGQVIAAGHNMTVSHCDPTAHAEVVVMRLAAQFIGNWRLNGVTLYVTLEPCLMCAGAMVIARLSRLVFASSDINQGAVESLYGLLYDNRLPHQVQVTSGVLAGEAASLLKTFFVQLRKKKN